MTNFSGGMRIATQKAKQNQWFRRMFTVALFVGLAIGFLLGAFTVLMLEECPAESDLEPPQTVTPAPDPEPDPVYLGKCKVMAYCACEICCGKWAKNRPNGVVYGASGEELVAGVSCASPLPFGTVLEVEGVGIYTVQDRLPAWVVDKYGENIVDIYLDNHQAALEFGIQYHDVYMQQ